MTEGASRPGPWLRDALAHFAPFVAVPAPDAGPVHLLAANESPDDPHPAVVAEICAAAAQVNRYPEFQARQLEAELAAALGVAPAQVLLGAGSVALLQMLLQAVAEPGAEVVYGWRSFEVYPTLADAAGVTRRPVPLTEHAHDLPAMAAVVGERTRLVIVCNPNNPTGTVVGQQALETFLDQLPDRCLVVIDEAYYEYVPDGASGDALALLAARPNVVVLRTFSKAYGLAGLRVGYLIGEPSVVDRLRRLGLPFAVSSLAQRAARVALAHRAELLARVRVTIGERDRVLAELTRAGWSVPASAANFIWLPTGGATADFQQCCGRAGVSVKAFAGEGVRVSIGSAAANTVFLAAATEWIGGLTPRS